MLGINHQLAKLVNGKCYAKINGTTPVRLLINRGYLMISSLPWSSLAVAKNPSDYSQNAIMQRDDDLKKWWFWEALAFLSIIGICINQSYGQLYQRPKGQNWAPQENWSFIQWTITLEALTCWLIPMFPLFLGWPPQSSQLWANTWSISSSHIPFSNNQSGSTKVPKFYWTKCENKSHNFLSHHDYKRLQTIPSKWAKGNKITSQLIQTMHPAPQKKDLHKIGSTSSHPCHFLTFLLSSETLRSHACKQYQIRSSTL